MRVPKKEPIGEREIEAQKRKEVKGTHKRNVKEIQLWKASKDPRKRLIDSCLHQDTQYRFSTYTEYPGKPDPNSSV